MRWWWTGTAACFFALILAVASCGDSGGPPEVAAVVDRGTEPLPAPPAWQPGEDYPYDSVTMERYEALLEDPAWRRPQEARSSGGLLLAVHRQTGMSFILIPGGKYLMGSPESEPGREKDEGPRHVVTVPAFLLSRTECRQNEWERGGGANPSEWVNPSYPVNNVTWLSARSWCEGLGLRLPSEAEWEYACRARSTGRWFFGDDESELPDFARYAPNAGNTHDPVSPSGSMRPNPFGLYDMLGNVAEWCEDTWHDDYVGAPNDGSAWTVGGGPARVSRGGGWISLARTCRSAARRGQPPSAGGSSIGLRPAASLP